MTRRGLALFVALFAAAGCARRLAPSVPETEDYLFPTPAPGELSRDESRSLTRAWRDVLTGDVSSATRRLQKLQRGGSMPRRSVETALAYASLRAGRLDEAERGFAIALSRAPDFAPALAGAGSAAARQGRVDLALAFCRRALAAAPLDAVLRRRVAALKLQVTERHMTRAQAALQAGDLAAAASEYRAALDAAPEVTDVRLALAELLARQGDPMAAIAALAADPNGDRQVRLRLAALLVETQRFDNALDVYRGLLTRDPADAAARSGESAARERLETAAMPEEYRQIPDAPALTRADLAALLVVRVKALRRAGALQPEVAVDIAGSWAREQIAIALALEIMDVYPNHTFQPGAIVRRVDVARAAARVLDRLSWPRSAPPEPNDMPRSHLDYDAVQRVLGAGLMRLTTAGAFEPWRPVTGREALETVDSLARLIGP